MIPTKGHRSLELIFQLIGLAFYMASLSSSALITSCWCLHILRKSTVIPTLSCGETEAQRDLWMLNLLTHG